MRFNQGYSVFCPDLEMYALGGQLRVVRILSGQLFSRLNEYDYITLIDEDTHQTGV